VKVEEIFVKRMRELRQGRGWTQATLRDWMRVEGVDLHRSAVAAIEIGKRHVRLEEAHAIAKALNVPLSDLMTLPDCSICNGTPPKGFTCTKCGAES
jgi:transcriptional regulator with XRE-family HTH domain